MPDTPPPPPPRPGPPPLRRRTVLLGTAGAILGAAGCTSTSPSATTSPTPNSAAGTTATGGTPTPQPLPATTPWLPGPGEVEPDVKLRAVELVEALGAWGPGGEGLGPARARVAALGLDPALADQAGPLLPSAPEAAVQVVVAQYGGLLADSASVMVPCRQWTRAADGGVAPGGTTLDVRLSRAQPRWTVTALQPAQPGAAAAVLPAAAARVLAEPRIQLPPAAVADLQSGSVHQSVLEAMLTLARDYTFAVTVVRSGHPIDVYGTDRPSDHPPGRAFDVWQIDGRMVVDPATPHDLVDGFMRAAAAAGSYNVGGPRQLPTVGNQFFSDVTHRDHVHVGFRS
ncbi:hypothetical protein [Kitasatospora camelliae]|uniref:Uncharacterized protein n=1 Tax=Kitasatospora camelliae TaxID=3156397 RepID=A0AAU8K3J8_9ACTN